jgi:pyruvate/2-oxoglutarate dehydrogenase complex dihydrolipoamide dehydrogenase (E3) component
VTIVHRGERPLEQFDRDLVDRLVARTRAAGVDVRLGAEARSVESSGTGRRVMLRNDDETINLFALAMRAGVTADRFREILWAYPTHASDTQYMV